MNLPADTTSLLRFYEALECASQEMLEAARNGDWDSVCRLEGACAVLITRLRQAAQEEPLAPGDQPQRMRLLRNIVANDAEIRRIAQPMPAFLDSRPNSSAFMLPASLALH